jgi:hypothetical protein
MLEMTLQHLAEASASENLPPAERRSKFYLPKELVEQHKTHYVHFRKKSDE